MSSDAIVTIEGWVGNDPQSHIAGDTNLARFRLGHTPRRYRRQTGEWADGETQWFTVSAWRRLGEHCARSIRKGDPVIVHGRLSQRTWRAKSGEEVVSLEIDAFAVGHNLTLGTAAFTRSSPSVRSASSGTPAGAAAGAGSEEAADPVAAARERAQQDWSAA